MTDSYRGMLGAIPYAIRATDSWTMRVYGVVGGFAAALVAVVVTLALVVWMGETAGLPSGTYLFSRSLYVVIGLAAVAPLLAPLLFVARRHRRGLSVATGYDRWMAVAGFCFLASLYVGVVISAPAELRDPSGFAVVNALYALPRPSGAVPPVVAALVVFLAHYRLRGGDEPADSSPDSDAEDPPVGADDPS